MPRGFRRSPQGFEVPVHDMVLRITAPEEFYEEARAAALQFWEQLQSYGIRHPAFRTSKRALTVPDDAPAVVRRMAEVAGTVGVGPMFTFPGALTEHVGRILASRLREVVVVNGGDYFLITRKRSKLTVHHQPDGDPLAVVIRPDQCPLGVSTTMGQLHTPAESADAVVVLADSCILADATAAGLMAILARGHSMPSALRFLRQVSGVHGAIVMTGDRIGLAGSVEIAA